MLKYKYEETEEIRKLLIELEALKIVFEQTKILPRIEENLQRESLLKSALFSARVEGNPLSLERMKIVSEAEKTADLGKLEVFNLLKAYRYLYSQKIPLKLSLSLIKRFHRLAMKNVSAQAGKIRTEPWAIFNSSAARRNPPASGLGDEPPLRRRRSSAATNEESPSLRTGGGFNQAGVAIYLSPAPFRLQDLMQDYIRLAGSLKYQVPIKAAIFQFLFEKIHPFADGNGRVGRLISGFIMQKGSYGFRGVISIEEVIDRHREEYYLALEPPKDAGLFVKFFLESFVDQAKSTLEKLNEKKETVPEDYLLPRRREVFLIIKDHPDCTFDFIFRRFPAVNPKTLHYDLKQLQEKRFIIKAGKTRGVTYRTRE